MNRHPFKTSKYQRGLSLILVLVLLTIAVSTSLYFHQRLVGSTDISATTRDNSTSLMLAESALEHLRGGYLNKLCTSTDCSLKDMERLGAAVAGNMDDVAALDTLLGESKVEYAYYVGAADLFSPGILQRVANIDAGSGRAACTINSHAVPAADCKLDINALFGAGYRPQLYTTNANGLLVSSSLADWKAVTEASTYNDTVAAAWIELTRSALDADDVDVWVQASAQVGIAKSYIQRYVGTHSPQSNVIGNLAALVEASNIDRE